jgi:pantoate--beta-alanine ligase
VSIEGVPTVREPDGLALSSRNAYLSPEERRTASALPAILRELARDANGHPDPKSLAGAARERLLTAGFDTVEYLSINEAATLAPATTGSPSARVFVAARIGRTRLIDNLPVGGG